MGRINVTKSFLPPYKEYETYVKGIWERDFLTNQGPLLMELQDKLKAYLGVQYFHFLTNGTLALQLALHVLGITEGEVITTPFSYVATTSSILWERCEPVFVDIEPETFCIDADKIEAAITPRTKAIMPVHVFGNPCDVEKIDAIAKKHKLKVIYDGAHAFGVVHNGRSLLSYGDISMCSFHATKLFHTIEGGGLIVNNKQVSEDIELEKRFGHNFDTHIQLGINAKANEFQAAMGLAVLPHLPSIISGRKKVTELYDALLKDVVGTPVRRAETYNYAYYPVLFKDEQSLLAAVKRLQTIDVYPRRYFYPSLNTLPYIKNAAKCPVSEDISLRILCLPLFPDLSENDVKRISEAIRS